MSATVTYKRINIIVVLTTILLLCGYSALQASKRVFDFDSTCHSTDQHSLTFSDHSNIDYSKGSMSKLTCSSINHCIVCGAVVSNYAINLYKQTKFTDFISLKFIANNNEFIPELRPPRIT